jgi:hypothetical protein
MIHMSRQSPNIVPPYEVGEVQIGYYVREISSSSPEYE